MLTPGEYAGQIDKCLTRAPWALRELVVDLKLQEWNRLYSTGRMFPYLMRRFGSAEKALSRLRVAVHVTGRRYTWPVGAAAQREYVLRHHEGVVEELVLALKLLEAADMNKTEMLEYLEERYGGLGPVIPPLRACASREPWRARWLREIRNAA